jgi:hypothetical protein
VGGAYHLIWVEPIRNLIWAESLFIRQIAVTFFSLEWQILRLDFDLREMLTHPSCLGSEFQVLSTLSFLVVKMSSIVLNWSLGPMSYLIKCYFASFAIL